MRHKNWGLVFVIISTIFLIGCQAAEPEFTRSQMLSDITNNVILPNHEAFVLSAENLETAVQTFAADPTEATLAAAQSAWIDANIAWMGVSLFRFGEIKDSLIHNRIDNRPPRVAFIDETINGDDTIDLTFVENIGSTSVGLGAIEYLIFDPVGGNTAVLDSFSSTTGSQKMDYLTALATYLNQQAVALNDLWLETADSFIEADMDGGDLQGSLNMLANRMLEDSENILVSRLGKPLGKRTNGEIRPDLAESIYGDISLRRIEKGLITIQDTFNGGDGTGLDDYLDFLDANYEEGPLSAAINERFESAISSISSIDEPLTLAVENQVDTVDASYEELRMLLVLLNVDMPAQMGLTLTFSDNDGD